MEANARANIIIIIIAISSFSYNTINSITIKRSANVFYLLYLAFEAQQNATQLMKSNN